MPIKRNFLNVLFKEQPEDSFFKDVAMILARKNLTLFLDKILERGKKTSGPEVVPLIDTDKEFAVHIFNEVTNALRSGLKNNKEFRDAITSYVETNKESFPLMSEIFAAYIKSV